METRSERGGRQWGGEKEGRAEENNLQTSFAFSATSPDSSSEYGA
jgi:hypothetical protein